MGHCKVTGSSHRVLSTVGQDVRGFRGKQEAADRPEGMEQQAEISHLEPQARKQRE